MNPDWNAGPKTVRGSTGIEAAEFEIKRLQDSNEALRARLESLENELRNIINADYRSWESGLDTPEEFVRWAKSRCRHTLSPTN